MDWHSFFKQPTAGPKAKGQRGWDKETGAEVRKRAQLKENSLKRVKETSCRNREKNHSEGRERGIALHKMIAVAYGGRKRLAKEKKTANRKKTPHHIINS